MFTTTLRLAVFLVFSSCDAWWIGVNDENEDGVVCIVYRQYTYVLGQLIELMRPAYVTTSISASTYPTKKSSKWNRGPIARQAIR